MIKAIIIDDEPLARMMVKEYLQSYADIKIVSECSDGFEGLKAINENKPELIFLDIQMPKITGFEMLELVEDPPAVIFTTAFDEYAIKAFDNLAIDYLLKPFSKERFDKAVSKFLKGMNKDQQINSTAALMDTVNPNPERIVIKDGSKIKIIASKDIHYLEAADDYVKIHTAEGNFLKNKTMSFFESSLPKHLFVRSHRSYIVNIQEITRIDAYEKNAHIAILRSGARIPVSNTGYSKLKEVLGV